MGIIRRHPWLTLALAVLLSPLGVLIAIDAAQHAPACSEWRAEVEETTDARMRSRYLGGGDEREFDRAYAPWDTTFEETRTAMRAEVAHEMKATRPDLCR